MTKLETAYLLEPLWEMWWLIGDVEWEETHV